ncbi:DEAD/DEAH box helicase [Sediminitomix flava]|uniref:SNF2 family DNA or RNA helicase n=1 Tax=Sediminitomix flava TaxID=379075 RepID=A0A315ZDZ1_SEDFL|nr:DEAD/DEAH box helicase [Sediminitomix flava]PWJ43785.1 SNF2 family DNA or RNA helicase [Sediminitomix flava]
MTRQTFGKTWWGEKWLQALHNIDFDNRLERGRNYANKGAVTQLSITTGKISAEVQGSFGKTYDVEINVPVWAKSEQEFIVRQLQEKNEFYIALLNHQLPTQLLDFLNQNDLQLFPKEWSDFKMSCTCPDWAVPCKHLAAVIYKISEEIDRNPLIILSLKGIEISEFVAEESSFATSSKQEKILSINDLISSNEEDEKIVDKPQETTQKLDFSNISEVEEKLLTLLSEKPLFYSKDFKIILKKSLNATHRLAKEIKKEVEQNNDFIPEIIKADEGYICLDEDAQFKAFLLHSNQEMEMAPNQVFNPRGVFEYLLQIPEDTIGRYNQHIQAMHYTAQFTLKLMLEKAIVPQLIKTEYGYTVRWVPVLLEQRIKKNIDALTSMAPKNLLLIQKEEGLIPCKHSEQILHLISIWISDVVQEACYSIGGSQVTDSDEKVLRLFFSEEIVKFRKEWDKEIPNAVHLWLQKMFISNQTIVPVFVFAEREDLTFSLKLKIKDQKKGKSIELSKYLNEQENAHKKLEVLKDLHILTEYFPSLEKLISDPKSVVTFDLLEFEDILFKILPIIELLGIEVILPKSMQKLIKPQLSLEVKRNENERGKAQLSLSSMLDFDWKIALGDAQISEDEFKQLIRNKSGLLRFKNFYVHLEAEQLNKLLRQLEKPPKVSSNELLQTALSEQYEGTPIKFTTEIQEIITEFTKNYDVESPNGLKATLRAYQQNGYSWLYKNARLGMGSILADDMGLGKTLQTIATLLKFKEDGLLDKKKAIVVVPTSLLTNWGKEIIKFAPNLEFHIYHGSSRKLNKEFDVLITTYGVMRTDLEKLQKIKWFVQVIDEAQNVKNVSAAQSKATKSLRSDIKIALSGTPVENRLSEYWSIMDFVNKGYLGTSRKFSDKFAKPIQNDHDQNKLSIFKKITAPFILRRLKSDKSIIQDLPEKIEQDIFCHLEKEQASLYQKTVDDTIKSINKAKDDKDKRKGLVLKLIMSLKQICNHPNQFLKQKNNEIEASGKSKMLLSILDKAFESNEKVLIFTQYKEMGNMLQEWIDQRYYTQSLFLHGGCSRKQRDEMVDQFQQNPHCKIFILSLKAGGTGLNLTKAQHVIHYDLWWNPAVESQATDRAYRIGQQNNVLVHRLICTGTFEEKIDAMIKSKKELANMTVSTGEQWIGDLKDDELKELVSISEDISY